MATSTVRQEFLESRTSTAWSTGTILAVVISLTTVLILSLTFYAIVRRRRKFRFSERQSVAEMAWSPVTTFNSTPFASPFASHNNSPMRPTAWEKHGSNGYYVPSRNQSEPTVYTDMVQKSPCAMKGKRIEIIPEDDDEGDEVDDERDERRSISPLDMSPILARLPSVKSGSSARISELVRGGPLVRTSSAERWEGHRNSRRQSVMSVRRHQVPNTHPKIGTRLSIIDRRSALISVNEFSHLFQGRNSGLVLARSTPDV